ncbi:MAG: hypothetical protein ABFS35_02335 [Bacteroidota bacterium]
MPKTKQWEKFSESSYTDNNGKFRTFLNVDEVANYLKKFKLIHKWEGLGEKHKHGNGAEEQHHKFELILSIR